MSPPPRPVLELERVYDASPEAIYAAWLDPDALRVWMCPDGVLEAVAELDPREGGRFTITMRMADGEVVHTGEYRELRPPERLVFTWSSENTNHEPTLVTVALERMGPRRTRLRLVHEALPDADAERKHRGGWTGILEKLGPWLEAHGTP
jgi:uncharacterized protein YndB with AHSA1/START domain